MKKIAISVFALALATCAFAQKKNVNAAEGKLYEPKDLVGAQSLIEKAMVNPETSGQARTFMVAAQVYENIYLEEETKRQMNGDFNQARVNEALVKAADAYKVASELDVKPNEKGQIKPKYVKNIPGKIETLKNYLINAGLANYNAGSEAKQSNGAYQPHFEAAVDLWSKYIEMADYPVMAKSNMKADTLYNEIKYYTVNAASSTESREAVALQYMNELKTEPKYSQTMYEWLYSTYQKKGDETNSVAILKEAVNKYPSNAYFIGSLINYYLDNKKDAEAVAYVDDAISKDPKNVQYYLIKSKLYLQKSDFNKAIEVAKQAIAVEPNNFDANYFCGFAYVKNGESAYDKAGKIKDNKKYNAAVNLAKEQFKSAIPYLEKARSINAKDANNLNLLKTSYYRIGNGAKYSEIDAQLKKIQ